MHWILIGAALIAAAIATVLWRGRPGSPESLADIIADLKARGAHVVQADQPGQPVVELELSQRTTFNLSQVDRTLKRLSGLRELRVLTLGASPVSNKGLAVLANFQLLQHLNLGACRRVNDATLRLLSTLTELEVLNLGATKVTDAGLQHLAGLSKLRSLALYMTRITDRGLEHVKGLLSLQTLNVNKTQVTDAGVEELLRVNPSLRVER